jgi:hypothetical protein
MDDKLIDAFAANNSKVQPAPAAENGEVKIEATIVEPVKTEPKVEVKQEIKAEVQPTKIETKAEPEKVEAKVEPKPEVSHADILAELSGGKIKSAEDLKAILEKADTPQKEINAIAKSLNDAMERGLSAKQWADQQRVDVDSYSNVDLAKEYLKQTKGWDDKKVEAYLENKYLIDETPEEGYETREYKLAQIELEDLAETAKKHFNSQKIDLDNFQADIPELKQTKEKLTAYEQQIQNSKLEQENLAKFIDSSLNDVKDFSFEYSYKNSEAKDAKDSVTVQFTEEQIKNGKEIMKSPAKLLQMFSKDGNLDAKEMLAKIIFLTDQSAQNAFANDIRAKEREEMTLSLKNANFKGAPAHRGQVTPSKDDKLVNAFVNNGRQVR